MLKMKLRYRDWSDCVRFVTKTRDDNDMIDHISLVYAEIETELLWPIWPCAICDEKQTGKWCDRLYRCCLHQKQNWVILIDQIECGLWQKLDMIMIWPIIQL